MIHIVLVPTRCAHLYTHVSALHCHSGRDCRNPEHRDVKLVILFSRSHALRGNAQARRAAPRVTTNILSIRDATRPALRSHAARGNEGRVEAIGSRSASFACTPVTMRFQLARRLRG